MRLSVIRHPPTQPPASFPTWLRQRGVSIGSPFSPRLPMLHQRCFDSLDPSLLVHSKSFCPHLSLFLVSICLPLSGELTSKCLSALDEECQVLVRQATGIITLLLTIVFATSVRVLKDMDPYSQQPHCHEITGGRHSGCQ